jgi:hypothetical protein
MQLFECERLLARLHGAPVYHVLPNSSWFAARLLADLQCLWIRASVLSTLLGSVSQKSCDADFRRPQYRFPPSLEPKLGLSALPTSHRRAGLFANEFAGLRGRGFSLAGIFSRSLNCLALWHGSQASSNEYNQAKYRIRFGQAQSDVYCRCTLPMEVSRQHCRIPTAAAAHLFLKHAKE